MFGFDFEVKMSGFAGSVMSPKYATGHIRSPEPGDLTAAVALATGLVLVRRVTNSSGSSQPIVSSSPPDLSVSASPLDGMGVLGNGLGA